MSRTVDLDLTLVVENERRDFPRVTARLEILAIGSVRDLCLLLLQLNNEVLVKVDAHEQTTDQEEKTSGTEDHPQLHGVKVELKDHKKDQDPQGANSRNDQSLSEPLLLLSKTTSGEPRCDLMHQLHQLQNHLFHRVMVVRPHPLQLQAMLNPLVDLS